MRKYLRAIARYNMEKQGVQHINKREMHGKKKEKSYFAESWKMYLNSVGGNK